MDDEALASFVAVTGASEAEAAQMLEATNGSLQEAVELFFAAGAGGGGAAAAGAPAAGAPGEDDEALARRLQQCVEKPAPSCRRCSPCTLSPPPLTR
jgi:hypothetical protein